MLNSLPSRPLTQAELDALSSGETIEVAYPATPESIQENDEDQYLIFDLLLFAEETVIAVAYQEAETGWIVVAKETDEDSNAYESAYDKLLEYRGYGEIEREDAMRQVITKLYGIPEELVEANPDEFESLGGG